MRLTVLVFGIGTALCAGCAKKQSTGGATGSATGGGTSAAAGTGSATANVAAGAATPASVCAAIGKLDRRTVDPAKKQRAATRCARMMTKLQAEHPERVAKVAACVREQKDMQGFKNNCMMVLLGGKTKALAAMKKYLRRSKSISAKIGLRTIKSSASMYYLDKKQFPASTKWYPAKACCEYPNKRCPASAPLDEPGLKQLFGTLTLHLDYFQFRFVSKGKGAKATYTAEAKGDPSCDGKVIKMTQTGSVDDKGNVVTTPIATKE